MSSTNNNSFFKFSDRTDLTAIIQSDFSISYRDLFAESNIIAQSFFNAGIKKNNYAPLLIEDQLKFIVTTIALWNLGAIPVPLNTKLLVDEISTMIEDYNFKILITDKDLSINPKKRNFGIIKLNEITNSNVEDRSFSIPSEDDEAVVIFTSGTSGKSKGVVHTFTTLINSIENGNQILMHKEKDQWLASLPFYHIGGFQIICRSLFYGCSIIIPESLQTKHLADAIGKFNPTHLSLVSAQIDKLITQNIKPPKSLKLSLIGGGFIDDELMFEADNLRWKPFRVYGSSETGSMVTAIPASETKSKPLSVGKWFSNIEIKISDDSEILIKSNSIFKKYLDNEQETSFKLVDGYYLSGDLGYVDDNRYLFIEARRSDLIVTGGENVNPIEVENALLELPYVKDACVFPKQNKTWGQIIAAAIVKSDPSVVEKNIQDILKQRLVGYKIPKKIYFTDELPRTPLGKLEREKIKKMF